MSSCTTPFKIQERSSSKLWRLKVDTCGLLHRSPPSSTHSSNLIHLIWKEKLLTFYTCYSSILFNLFRTLGLLQRWYIYTVTLYCEFDRFRLISLTSGLPYRQTALYRSSVWHIHRSAIRPFTYTNRLYAVCSVRPFRRDKPCPMPRVCKSCANLAWPSMTLHHWYFYRQVPTNPRVSFFAPADAFVLGDIDWLIDHTSKIII